MFIELVFNVIQIECIVKYIGPIVGLAASRLRGREVHSSYVLHLLLGGQRRA